jgi:hypothetical protein
LLQPDQRDGVAVIGGMAAAAIVPALGQVARGGRVFAGQRHATLIGRRIGISRARPLRRRSARHWGRRGARRHGRQRRSKGLRRLAKSRTGDDEGA